ncbi:MAG TPA: polysaccharide biosynthesis C-terminal domain-containing protein [Methanocella sp.]|jgi:O-antigen/teichoic acid export membrane protein
MSQSVYRNIVRDIGVLGLSSALVTASGIFLLPIITRNMGVANYGLYVQFMVTVALVSTFAPLGLPYATVRFLAGHKDKKVIRDDVWSTMVLILIASLVFSAFFFLFADVIAKYLFDGHTFIVLVLAVILPVECMNVSMLNLFRVFQQNIRYAVVMLVKTYADLAIIVFMINNGYGIESIFVALLGLRLILFALLAIYTVAMVGLSWPRFLRMREYFRFGVPNIPANIASWVSDVSDRYLIGIMLGTAFVGIYNPGYTLGQIISIFMQPVDFVLVSAVSKYYNENRIDLVRNIFRFALKYYLLIAVPACCGISLLSRQILLLITTPEIADQGYLITPFVAFSMLLFGMGGVAFGKSLFLANRNDINAAIWLLMAAVNLVLNLILIPTVGIIGAAAATTIAYALGFLISVHFAMKFFWFDIDWPAIVRIVIASIIMSAVVYFMSPSTLPDLIVTIVAGFVVYVVVVLLLGAVKRSEIDFFRSFSGTK